jgi:hypothetical protein
MTIHDNAIPTQVFDTENYTDIIIKGIVISSGDMMIPSFIKIHWEFQIYEQGQT